MAEKQSETHALTDSTGLPKLAPIPSPPQHIIDNIVRSAPNPPTTPEPLDAPKK